MNTNAQEQIDKEYTTLLNPIEVSKGIMLYHKNTTNSNEYGKIIFSLDDLPIGINYMTPNGQKIQRINANEVRYANVKKLTVTSSNINHDQKTSDQMIQEAQIIAQESKSSANKILQKTEEMKLIGTDTLQMMANQNERIRYTQGDLDDMSDQQKRMAREIRGINGLYGEVINCVTSEKITPTNNSRNINKEINKKQIKKEKERIKNEKVVAKKNNKKKKLTKKDKKYNDITPAVDYPTEVTKILGKDTQNVILETDIIMDQINHNVTILGQMAREMNDNLDEQNTRLKHINISSNRVDLKNREYDHIIRNM